MPPSPPAAARPVSPPADDSRLRRIERLSYLLDNSIRLPGVGYRIGYDALIGLIPGVGDAAGIMLSTYIIWEAARLGASRRVLARMVYNVGVEALVGIVPLFGDMFDATWKANARNVHLLHEHLGLPIATRKPSTRRALLVLFGGLLLVIVILVVLIVLIIRAVPGLAGG